uniref:Uncharacterized protein n=1 Tax=Cajanus cajan TaxID=3821 RepID=A0A151S3S5_CAJCA|nr:hypothetical protein KK1_028817 [Cajanus cajan]
MNETRTNFKNQEASIRNLENQIGQISRQLSERPPGTFPSDTITNPREQCKEIQLRSGKVLMNEKKSEVEGEKRQGRNDIERVEKNIEEKKSEKNENEINCEKKMREIKGK